MAEERERGGNRFRDVNARQLVGIQPGERQQIAVTLRVFLRFRLLEGTLSPAAYTRSVASCREALPGLFAHRLDPGARAQLAGFLERCAPFFDELPTVPLPKVG